MSTAVATSAFVGNILPRTPSIETDAPLHALRITLDTGQAVWIPSNNLARDHVQLADPGAVILDARIHSLPNITESGGLVSGTATISTGTYQIIDDTNHSFADWIADKNVNNIGVRHRLIEEFEWPSESQQLNIDDDLNYTFLINGLAVSDDVIHKIAAIDINRELDTEIFEPRTWRLGESITDTSQIITLTTNANDPDVIPNNDVRFQHDSSYPVSPDLNIGYALIEDGDRKEVFGYTQVDVSGNTLRFLVPDVSHRGLFGTTAQSWDVDQTADDDAKPTLTEYIYLRESGYELIYMLLAGESVDGTRVLPSHWSANLDTRWVNAFSLSQSSNGDIREFRFPEAGTVQKQLEDHLLITLQGSVLLPNERGELTLLSAIVAGESGPSSVTFSPENVDMATVSDYAQDYSQLKADLVIRWGRERLVDDSTYLTSEVWRDEIAIARNRSTGAATYEIDTLHPGNQTSTAIEQLTAVLYDKHAYPLQTISFPVSARYRYLSIGTRVQVDFPTVQDHLSDQIISTTLNRQMIIAKKTYNRRDRTVSLSLVGTLNRSQQLRQYGAPQVPEEECRRDGVDLLSLPGVTNTGGIIGGSPALSMRQKYFLIGDFTLGPTFNPTFADFGPYFQLWCCGVLVMNDCTIDVSSRSFHDGGDGAANVPGAQGQPGSRGYAFVATGAGGLVVQHTDTPLGGSDLFRRSTIVSSLPGFTYPARYFNVQRHPLEVNDGRLTGLPDDLGGSGGPGTGATWWREDQRTTPPPSFTNTPVAAGRKGARGGGGILIVSHGGSSISANTVLDTSAQGRGSGAIEAADTIDVAISPGGSGTPGCIVWAIDGAGGVPVFTSNNVQANTSRQTLPAGSTRAPAENTLYPNGSSPVYHSFYTPISSRNLWESAAIVLTVPSNQTTGARDLSGLDAAFADQFDLNFELLVTDADPGVNPPSNANPKDIAILRTLALNESIEEPTMYQLINGVWEQFNWNDSIYRAVGRNLLDQWRQSRAVRFWNGRPATPPGKIGDRYYDTATGVVLIIGETVADDIPVDSGHDLGDSVLIDSYFEKFILYNQETWSVSDDRFDLPEVLTGAGGGSSGSGSGVAFSITVNEPVVDGIITGSSTGYAGRSVFIDFPTNGADVQSGPIAADGSWSIARNAANDGFNQTLLTAFVDDGTGQFSTDQFIYRTGAATGNQAPFAGNDTANVNSGGSTTIAVTGNDNDPDGFIDFVTLQAPPNHGAAVVNADDTITYTHNGNGATVDTFSYTVTDNAGAQSNVATVTVTIAQAGADPFQFTLLALGNRQIRITIGSGYAGRSAFFDVPGQATAQGHPNPGGLSQVGSQPLAKGDNTFTMTTGNDAFDGFQLTGFIQLADASQQKSSNAITYAI